MQPEKVLIYKRALRFYHIYRFSVYRCLLLFSPPSHADTAMPTSGNPERLSRKASGVVLQPEAVGGVPRCRETHHASRRPGRTKRYVMHDPSGRRTDGLQHIRTGRRAADKRDFDVFDGLRRSKYPLPVQDHPSPCCGGERTPMGARCRFVARSGPYCN